MPRPDHQRAPYLRQKSDHEKLRSWRRLARPKIIQITAQNALLKNALHTVTALKKENHDLEELEQEGRDIFIKITNGDHMRLKKQGEENAELRESLQEREKEVEELRGRAGRRDDEITRLNVVVEEWENGEEVREIRETVRRKREKITKLEGRVKRRDKEIKTKSEIIKMNSEIIEEYRVANEKWSEWAEDLTATEEEKRRLMDEEKEEMRREKEEMEAMMKGLVRELEAWKALGERDGTIKETQEAVLAVARAKDEEIYKMKARTCRLMLGSEWKDGNISKLRTERNQLQQRLETEQKSVNSFKIEHQEMKRCEGIMRNLFDDTTDRYLASMGASQKKDEKIVELSTELEFYRGALERQNCKEEQRIKGLVHWRTRGSMEILIADLGHRAERTVFSSEDEDGMVSL